MLNQDMDMVVTAMSTEPLRALLEVIMARDLLSLDMVTAPELATITEVPGEFKAMVMEVITKDLQSLAMAITMDMDNLMSTRTVIITMDLMDMRLSMITRRDLLRPNQDMDMEDTAMSTEPLRALLKVIMARDLLSLDMVTAPELAITTEVLRVFRDMGMEVTIRDLPNLVMVTPQA